MDGIESAHDQAVQQCADLIKGIARLLVDQPDQVVVESEDVEDETTLFLIVAENDMGKLLGKQGRTARSVRTVLNAVSSKSDLRLSLDIEAAE